MATKHPPTDAEWEVTAETLHFFVAHLRENEPSAVRTIADVQNAISALPESSNELEEK